MNKLIVIEGTDCSGKETQAKLLVERLKDDDISVKVKSYPNYESGPGKIIGGPYLGKKSISDCWFKEGAVNVDARVASLYYAADRLYDKGNLEDLLKESHVILDRYIYSNMAHQGGKELDKDKRMALYKWLDELEFGFLNLLRPDIKVLLYMPYEYSCVLKKNRSEMDEHESSEVHLKNAENAYLELASLYGFKIINCVKNDLIRSIDDINDELYGYVKKKLK